MMRIAIRSTCMKAPAIAAPLRESDHLALLKMPSCRQFTMQKWCLKNLLSAILRLASPSEVLGHLTKQDDIARIYQCTREELSLHSKRMEATRHCRSKGCLGHPTDWKVRLTYLKGKAGARHHEHPSSRGLRLSASCGQRVGRAPGGEFHAAHRAHPSPLGGAWHFQHGVCSVLGRILGGTRKPEKRRLVPVHSIYRKSDQIRVSKETPCV